MPRPRGCSPGTGSWSARASTVRPRSRGGWRTARRRTSSRGAPTRTCGRSPIPGMTWMSDTEVEGLLRRLAPQVLGAVVRRYGHFDTAEDAVQEALLAASRQWPAAGIPDNPRSWLITVAARRLTDLLRSEQARQRRENTVASWALPAESVAPAADRPAAEADDTLTLLFTCGHPPPP